MVTWRERGSPACAICAARMDDAAARRLSGTPSTLSAREALDAHLLLRHSPAERMQAAFRAVLPHIPPGRRQAAVLAFYRGLRSVLDVADRQGVFGLEETLGSVALYRLWIGANHSPERWRARAAGVRPRSSKRPINHQLEAGLARGAGRPPPPPGRGY